MQHNHIYHPYKDDHPYKDGHQVDPSRPIFYVIQNTKTGIYYAGYKKNKKRFLIEKGYTTSSNIVNEIIQNEGLAIWRIMKIRYFESAKEALKYETKFLHKVNAKTNSKFYNKHNGSRYSNLGYTHSQETKEKMSLSKIGKLLSKETCIKMSLSKLGTIHSAKTKEKMRKAKIGKSFCLGYFWWNDGLSTKLSTLCPGLGWYKGRLKRKISL